MRTTDTSLCPEWQTLIHCFICVLSIFNLSKGLSNIQFHLAESQTKRVSTKKSHGLFQMIPFSCSKDNKVIFKSKTVINECKVSLACTQVAVTIHCVAVNMSVLVFVSIKHVSGMFF